MAAWRVLYLQEIPAGGVTLNDWNRLTERVESMCNPNLLINTDFRNPVNQRGQSEYVEGGYCIDMWDNVGGNYVYLTENGIRIKNDSSQEKWFTQKTELSSKELIKNGYTFSAEVDGIICTFVSNGKSDEAGLEGKNIHMYTSLDGEYATFFFATYPGCDVTISHVKLELGAFSTLANEVVDYAAELRKCQRYYQQSWVGDIGTGGIITKRAFTNARMDSVSFLDMRTTPTVTIYNSNGTKDAIKEWESGIEVLGCSAAFLNNKSFVPIAYNTNLEIGKTYAFHYTLSAEL